MNARDFFYSSLYTAAFPPCFTDPNQKTYTFYLHYLAVLRNEFLEKIEFCFDKDYYPEVLGGYTQVQRYALYCEIKDIPTYYSSTSEYRLNRYAPPEVMMKYFSESLAAPKSEQLKEFRKKYNLDENYRVNPSPQKLSIVTEVRSLYDISERQGKILDYMKLSLDADLLPKIHAAGGEADIVYEYPATDYYPEHSLLLEATLADRTNQRRMEMEPVSRHLGMHLIRTGNLNSYCVFATTYLDINVTADFRNRKTVSSMIRKIQRNM